jgi:predicted porin
MNNFSIGAQYEDTDNLGGVKNTDYTAWAITGKYTFGHNAISAVYTDAEIEPDASNSDIDRDGWGLAAEHNFSKRTKVYAAYASGSIDYDHPDESDDDNDVFSLGMIHNF